MTTSEIGLVSIELTNRCKKACWFCYNHSGPERSTSWTVDELVGFVADLAAHGVWAVSFGGGEPLEFDGLFEVLRRTDGMCGRSLTTNGLLLDERIDELCAARPDKVHVSIHFPDRPVEVARVIRQVGELAARGVASGVNLLVTRSSLPAARAAAASLRAAGIGNDRVVYLPMRGRTDETPTPQQIAAVAAGPFQSMSCLSGCARSPRFCSVGWDRRVAWCSYTESRRELPSLTFGGLVATLDGLGLEFCGAS
jgi:MoaA/NifB/PqqE/SkfB family radical SAM enzyme